jgi:hypothetical protein
MKCLRYVLIACLLTACATPQKSTGPGPVPPEFKFSTLAKTEVDQIADLHFETSMEHLRLLTEKLYRRNPREWKKSNQPSLEAAVARIFDGDYQQDFAELEHKRGIDALYLAFQEEFQGDRVLALSWGLASMSLAAYNGKRDFYAWDDLDPQKLYNAARNYEIAVWKLSSNRDSQGQLFLLSNEINPDARNLSFEREFGKLLAEHDMMAKIVAGRTNRTIVRVLQNLATTLFIPLSVLPK